MRRVPALEGGVVVHGAKMPVGWVTMLEQYAMDTRITRTELIRRTISDWLKKHPEFPDIHTAANSHNRSYGQQLRQIMEDELPTLCTPIQEWRGDGRRHANAVRAGRVGKVMVPKMEIKLPPHAISLLRRVAKAKPELYPGPEAVLEDLAMRWVSKQLERLTGEIAAVQAQPLPVGQ